MKKIVVLVYFTLLTFYCFSQPFTRGNIVVVRIGSGAGPMTIGNAQPVFLDEYNPCGTLVRSIPMPTAVNGSNKRLTLPISTDYTEGYISLSQDGRRLAIGGYDADSGTASVSATPSATVKRVIAIIDSVGTVNTTTALNTFNTQLIRSAVVNGTDIWVTGSSGGVLHTTVGGTTQTTTASTTGRSLAIFNGQLYASSTSGTLRMTTVGTGLPVTTGQTMVNLPGYPTTGNPYQFIIINAGTGSDVLYVAHENLLRKYSLSGSTWVSNGAIGTANDKYRGLTGQAVTGGNVILYAVRRNDNSISSGGEVVTFTDNTGYNSDFSALLPVIVAQAPENTVFRAVAMAPDTSKSGMAPMAVMSNTLESSDQPTSFAVRLAPNPATDKVLVTFNNGEKLNTVITVANSTGQTIKIINAGVLQTGEININTTGFAKGVYYVTLNNGKNKKTEKLLIL